MKRIIITIPLLASLLGGCIFSGNQSEILTGEDGRVLAGRNQYDAHVDGLRAIADAIKSISDAAKEPSSKTKVTFDDDNKPVFTAECNTASTVLAAKIDTILPQLNVSQVPKNAVAQVIEATGGAAKDILTTPAAVGGVVAVTAVEVAKHAGDQNGDNYDIKVIGDGTATGPATSGDTIMQPEVLGVE